MWRKQGMDYYDIIFNELQNRVNREELTLEMAEEINDLAYNKYICEKGCKNEDEINPILEKIKAFNKELCTYEYVIVKPGGKKVENIKKRKL